MYRAELCKNSILLEISQITDSLSYSHRTNPDAFGISKNPLCYFSRKSALRDITIELGNPHPCPVPPLFRRFIETDDLNSYPRTVRYPCNWQCYRIFME